jgi:hypothetical protein
MYNTDIQTTISILGYLVFVEYRVTESWAIEWWLTPGVYDDKNRNEAAPGAELLETLLRAHHSIQIENILSSEFESRQYEQEQMYAAETAKTDIPF